MSYEHPLPQTSNLKPLTAEVREADRSAPPTSNREAKLSVAPNALTNQRNERNQLDHDDMIYEKVFREFEFHRVRYLLVGGMAVNIYGYVRMTMDLDVMVDLSEENLSSIIRVMEKLGFSPRLPVDAHDLISAEKRDEWIEKKGSVVFTFIDPLKPFRQIDVFLTNPVSFWEAYARRKEMTVGGVTLCVAGLDDLIAVKELAGRPRDLEDVNHLKRIKALKEKG